MTDPQQTLEEFREKLADALVDRSATMDGETVDLASRDTLVAESQSSDVIAAYLADIPRVQTHDSGDDLLGDLRIVRTLGRGGAGIVHLAQQVSLSRQVAVKTARAESSRAATGILREAVTTGILEHPNIVPIYTIGQDAAGAPVIVMKRIEGVSWYDVRQGESLGDAELPGTLDDHLRVLLVVCNAVEFAHSRGIVHRDIKLENIMIGRFGEVYLLDWGIALAMNDDVPPVVQRPDSSRGIAGTPHCMAPEMTHDRPLEVDEQTDVYLLGALLHELLTGQERHQGQTLIEVLYNASRSEPVDYDGSVDSELAAIANRATARDKSDRFPDVASFREALTAHIEHRSAATIARAAREPLLRLQTLVADEQSDPAAIHDAFGEARFGLTQSLRLWADNDEARSDLQRCLELMIRYSIDMEHLTTAEALLRDLPEDNPLLAQQLERLKQRSVQRSAEVERLKRIRRAVDLRVGSRPRAFVALMLGALWGVSTLVAAYSQPDVPLDSPALTEIYAMALPKVVGIAVVAVVLFRKRLFVNRANQRVFVVLGGLLAAMVFVRLIAWQRGLQVADAHGLEMVMYGLAAVAIGAMSDLRIVVVGSLMFFGGAVAVVFWPQARLFTIAGVSFAFFAFLAAIWWRAPDDDESEPAPPPV